MENKSFKFFLSLQLITCSIFFQKSMAADDPFKYHTYIGGIGGVGSTTWGGLVPTERDQNVAMSLSTPTSVTEGGVVWGVFGGYEFTPYFAIEANYMKYPDATVSFDPMSLFSFMNDNLTEFTTRTETVGVMGKIMLIIPKANIRAFSSVWGRRSPSTR